MNGMAWRDAVVEYIRRETNPPDKYGHMPRLYALAAEIAGNLEQGEAGDAEPDDDVLFAAAWMHDLGVFIGHRPADPAALEAWDHVPYTIRVSRELLGKWGFPEGKLEAVCEAIRTHQPKDEPTLMEAVILRDADILEQLGAIGALRSLVKIGRDTRFKTYTSVIPVLERAVALLPLQLRLNYARKLALPRVQHLKAFLAGIGEEAGEFLF